MVAGENGLREKDASEMPGDLALDLEGERDEVPNCSNCPNSVATRDSQVGLNVVGSSEGASQSSGFQPSSSTSGRSLQLEF